MATRRRSRGKRIPRARTLKRTRLSRKDVTRGEFNQIIDILNERNVILNAIREAVQRLERANEVQFHRTAEIQIELDEIKRAWDRMKPLI